LKTRIAINGFGIGRNLFRLLLNHPTIEVVAINDLADKKTMAHLLKYDSIHGVLPHKVGSDEKGILVEEKTFFFHEKKFQIYLESLDINYVIEATGKYKTFEDLNAHIIAGAKKVILSAPSEVDSIKTVVIGVNDHILDGQKLLFLMRAVPQIMQHP
jgi:glyceraldehyde 3-phosphate dehydrogenase